MVVREAGGLAAGVRFSPSRLKQSEGGTSEQTALLASRIERRSYVEPAGENSEAVPSPRRATASREARAIPCIPILRQAQDLRSLDKLGIFD